MLVSDIPSLDMLFTSLPRTQWYLWNCPMTKENQDIWAQWFLKGTLSFKNYCIYCNKSSISGLVFLPQTRLCHQNCPTTKLSRDIKKWKLLILTYLIGFKRASPLDTMGLIVSIPPYPDLSLLPKRTLVNGFVLRQSSAKIPEHMAFWRESIFKRIFPTNYVIRKI